MRLFIAFGEVPGHEKHDCLQCYCRIAVRCHYLQILTLTREKVRIQILNIRAHWEVLRAVRDGFTYLYMVYLTMLSVAQTNAV
jgi:hypothetical protein